MIKDNIEYSNSFAKADIEIQDKGKLSVFWLFQYSS
jgi:hypothetical protein